MDDIDIFGKLLIYGRCIVPAGSVTDQWLEENNLLVCKGLINWHIFPDSRNTETGLFENRQIVNRWNKDHAGKNPF